MWILTEQNIFTLDGSVAQEAVQDTCRLYEQRIKTFGGLDVALLGIGRMGNIAANEPGSGIQSLTRLILIGNMSREEMENSFEHQGAGSSMFTHHGYRLPCSQPRAYYLTAWGDEKAEIMQKVVEGTLSQIPCQHLSSRLIQMHT